MFTAAVVLLCVIAGIFLYYAESIKCVAFRLIELNKLPAPPTSNVIIGNILHLHTTPDNLLKRLRQLARTYYPIYNIRVLHLNAVNVLSPEDFELILSNQTHIKKSLIYNLLHGWLGKGLLTSFGKKWFTRRKILTPAFHFSILQQFITTFNEETEQLVETLKEHCGKPINIVPHITQYTLKTIAETAMGTKLRFNTEREVAYRQAVFDIGEIILYRLLNSWFIVSFINYFSPKYLSEKRTLKILYKFTNEVIAEREKNFQEVELPAEEGDVYTGKTRLAMLDLMLTAKKREKIIDDEGIREEVATFMFEGHDTTAVALGYALMLIACHKNVQDQIIQEMTEVLDDIHKKPLYNDLQELKYMERVIKEVLRLYPSVHFISRELGEDLVTNSGYLLPKKSVVHLHIYDLHHNPDIYPDPEKFDPDRFLPENSRNRHPFAYVPFSAGPRNCIGQRFAMLELKAALCGILANFILEPVDTPDTIVLVADIVLRTKDGIKIKISPRL